MSRRRLLAVHRALRACHQCASVVGPAVHGPALVTPVMLVGQAPGVHEAGLGRPFAWTAGRTLFRWFEQFVGIDERTFRENVYFTAVARCFPGKSKSGGDRRPDRAEVEACRPFLSEEVRSIRPQLVLAVGTLAITEVLGEQVLGQRLDRIVGKSFRTSWHGVSVDVIPLPHPSGASPWPKIEPGKSLLAAALRLVREHPAVRLLTDGQVLPGPSPTGRSGSPREASGTASDALRVEEGVARSLPMSAEPNDPNEPHEHENDETETTPAGTEPNPGDPGPEIPEPRQPQHPSVDPKIPGPGAGPAKTAGDPRAWIP